MQVYKLLQYASTELNAHFLPTVKYSEMEH